jgi:hypothetical protein
MEGKVSKEEEEKARKKKKKRNGRDTGISLHVAI